MGRKKGQGQQSHSGGQDPEGSNPLPDQHQQQQQPQAQRSQKPPHQQESHQQSGGQRPPQQQRGPQQSRGRGQPQQGSYQQFGGQGPVAQQQGGTQQSHGQGPPQQQWGPQQSRGQGPPQQQWGPQQSRGQGPPQQQRGPQQSRGQGPPQQQGGPQKPFEGHQPGRGQQSPLQDPSHLQKLVHDTSANVSEPAQSKTSVAPADKSSVPVSESASVVVSAPSKVTKSVPVEAKPGQKQKSKGKLAEKQGASTGPTSSVSSGVAAVTREMDKIKITKTYNLPKRLPFSHEKGNHILSCLNIEVNFLPLKIKDPKIKIFHYDVEFKPDTPKFLLRPALQKLRSQYFPGRNPAFDGKKNLYVAGKKLDFQADTLRQSVNVLNHESGREKEFDITIKLVKENLTFESLLRYCQRGFTSDIPQTEIQAADVALRSGLTTNFIPAGRSFFSQPSGAEFNNLSGGMELWRGFYQSAIMASQPYLNVDVANKAFPIHQTVMQFLCSQSQCREEDYRNYTLEPRERDQLEKFIKGLKVEYEMPVGQGREISRRIYKVTGLGGNPIEETFQLKEDGPKISVGMYYHKEKGYQIKYPKLPLLKIGTKGSMVPLELCTIIGNQTVMRKLDEKQTSNMVRSAARPTFERKQHIANAISRANYGNNPVLKEFGIEVASQFEKVDAYVMKPPKLSYQNDVNVAGGVWRIDRENFRRPASLTEWGILNLNDRVFGDQVRKFEDGIKRGAATLGMGIGPAMWTENIRGRANEKIIFDKLKDFRGKGITLVFVILPPTNESYGSVKRTAELQLGVLTQCLKPKTVQSINPMTVTNILQKVNAKLRGLNHCISNVSKPEILKTPCMIIGADVTHPSPGPDASGIPSIAAVAASMDPSAFEYKMMYRLQGSREEMILDLADILEAQLKYFGQKNNRLPDKILYFRDGVSEGQFQMVLFVELEGILKACNRVYGDKPKPKVTFLVVQKRHHTRFFPDRNAVADKRNGNVPAGTLVDTKITHPNEVDFYLVSHQSIQGTARPTKYHLLWDENNIPQKDLEILTFYLCHLFARCTRSVSYPAPTYYAHLAAFRARAWWDRQNIDMKNLRKVQEEKGAISITIENNFPMFFV